MHEINHLDKIHMSPTFAQAVEDFYRLGVTISYERSFAGGIAEYNPRDNHIKIDPSAVASWDHEMAIFVHEMTHARQRRIRPTSHVKQMSREAFVALKLSFEVEAFVNHEKCMRELVYHGGIIYITRSSKYQGVSVPELVLKADNGFYVPYFNKQYDQIMSDWFYYDHLWF